MEEKLYGRAYMKSGANCGQAVLLTLAEEAGLTPEEAMKIASPLGGGCRAGEVCGACTGALMALGQVFANTDRTDKPTQEKAYAIYTEFVKQFKAQNGAMTCRDLTGCDTSTPEGKARFHDHPEIKENVCFKAVDSAIELARKLIAENK